MQKLHGIPELRIGGAELDHAVVHRQVLLGADALALHPQAERIVQLPLAAVAPGMEAPEPRHAVLRQGTVVDAGAERLQRVVELLGGCGDTVDAHLGEPVDVDRHGVADAVVVEDLAVVGEAVDLAVRLGDRLAHDRALDERLFPARRVGVDQLIERIHVARLGGAPEVAVAHAHVEHQVGVFSAGKDQVAFLRDLRARHRFEDEVDVGALPAGPRSASCRRIRSARGRPLGSSPPP